MDYSETARKEDLDFISQHVESKAINQITIGFSEPIILERRLKKKEGNR